MRGLYKVSIIWIFGMIFFPIGLQMVISNNPILIFLSFGITLTILFLTVKGLISEIKDIRKSKEVIE